jgi:alanine racemase
MDLITADITELPNIKEGDWATLWSPENSINLVSNYNDLISYELMTKITNRVIKST